MPTDTPVRMVCFDWGGVIVRICRSYEEGCRAADVEIHADQADTDKQAARHDLSLRYQAGQITEDEFFDTLVRGTDGRYTHDDLRRVHDAWLLGEYTGVRTLIDELHAIEGLSTGMLSNTNARHWERRLTDFPTAGLLHHQHASHLLRLAKPDPAIYAAYERKTGFTGPEILFFDDTQENIDAARAAGWRAEHIDHTGDTADQMRTHLRAHGVL